MKIKLEYVGGSKGVEEYLKKTHGTTTFEIKRATTIGRGERGEEGREGNDISLTPLLYGERSISRAHAIIDEKGRIRDRGSLIGTYVNGIAIGDLKAKDSTEYEHRIKEICRIVEKHLGQPVSEYELSKKVNKSEWVQLHDGDVVTFGPEEYTFKVRIEK